MEVDEPLMKHWIVLSESDNRQKLNSEVTCSLISKKSSRSGSLTQVNTSKQLSKLNQSCYDQNEKQRFNTILSERKPSDNRSNAVDDSYFPKNEQSYLHSNTERKKQL